MSSVQLFIEGEKIDLSDKEGINIKLNTQDINDISKVNAGYSKDFSVMATPKNNKFFKHYYNADIIGGFDARTKKSATIYLDDLFFISGKIRLTSTSLKNNLIVSYRIQFEGDVVNVKDLLGDRKLKDLNLSEYDHDYNSQNVLDGLRTSLFDGAVIYPLISSVNRWIYDSDDAFVNSETTKNIHYKSDDAEQSISYNELKPAVRVADIIDKIQEENNFNFVGDFFNRDYYRKLYIWFSNDAGQIKLRDESQATLINFTSGSEDWIDFSTNTINTQAVVDYPNFYGFKLRPRIRPQAGFEDVKYNYVVTLNDVEVHRRDDLNGDKNLLNFNYKENLGIGLLKFYIEASELFDYTIDLDQEIFGTSIYEVRSESPIINLAGKVVLQNQAPEIKQIDIIIGIIKMFNITLTADINGDIIWETLNEWYQKGNVYKNFEKYIDIDKTTIKRGKLFSEFDFKYQEPTTILGIEFQKNNIDAYGDLSKILTEDLNDPDSLVLDGGKLEIELPFENMVYERLNNIATGDEIRFQYGFAVDESLNPVVPKNLLFYNIDTATDQIGFKKEDGNSITLFASLNTPNHSYFIDDNDKQSLNFSTEFSTYNYSKMPVTLYSQFYKNYIEDMFSEQRRIYTFDAEIPNFILANINLNDRLIIQNNRYLINSINSNLTTGKTKLELLNDIYTEGDLILNQFYAEPNFINAVVGGGEYQSIIYNNGETVLSLVDEGNGIFASIEGATTINGVVTKKV